MAVNSERIYLGKISFQLQELFILHFSGLSWSRYMEHWHICLNLHWSSPFCSGITKYQSKEPTILYFEFCPIPASWQTGDAKNKLLLELEGNLAQVDSITTNCQCRYQDMIKFLTKNLKISIPPQGILYHLLLGNNENNSLS